MEGIEKMDFPKITLEDSQELSYSRIGEGFDGYTLVELDTWQDEHRWFIISGLVFKWKGRYFETYYYSTLKSESMSISDIEEMDTEVSIFEVFPKQVIKTIYVKESEL